MKTKETKIFDKYESDLEHNAIVGLMVKLIAYGLTSEREQTTRSLDAVLYINYLLEKLRK